jgi:glycosyltransferase involved in cell wall biosynthesis
VDGTWEKLEEYAAHDDRIRLIHSDKKSYGYQINMGFDLAQGKYVAIVETDDYIETEMYAFLYKIGEETGADYVKADNASFYTYKDRGRIFWQRHLWNSNPENYNKIIVPRQYEELYVNDFSIWAGIYNRQFLMDQGIRLNESKGAAYQDIGFAQQLLNRASSAYYSDKSFYRYRRDREGSSVNSSHGLEYVHQEFQWLMDNQKVSEYKKGFYRRLASAFMGELPRMLRAVDYDTESIHVKPHYEWIRKMLIEGASEYLPEFTEEFPMLELALDSLNNYCDRLKKQEQYDNQFLRCEAGEPIVIFGAGIRGHELLCLLLGNGSTEEIVMTDNNKALWNTTVANIPILAPQECVKLYGNAKYMIANKYHAKDIKKQLIELGISRECIREYLPNGV